MLPPAVSAHWLPVADPSSGNGKVKVVVDPALPEERSYSLLRVQGGPAILSLSPAQAHTLHLSHDEYVDDADLSRRAQAAGTPLEAVFIFYLAQDDRAVQCETRASGTRQLTNDDAEAFEALVAEAPDDDLDEAYVELDHWLVYGTFIGDKLVSAGSMYPWDDTQLADLGVITLPEFRGRGLGRATVQAMSAAALGRGYVPQYRCQRDNTASVALARAAGFTLLGEWDVIATDD